MLFQQGKCDALQAKPDTGRVRIFAIVCFNIKGLTEMIQMIIA